MARSFVTRKSVDYNKMLPYVVARALTLTAKDAEAEVRRQMPRRFDRPTPFTLNALRTVPATATRQHADVLVKDLPGKKHYLLLQEFGGTRKAALAKTLAIPVGPISSPSVRLNQYGNAPRNIAKALMRREDAKYRPAAPGGGTYGGGTFSGIPRGRTAKVAGIYRRPKRRVAIKGKRKGQVMNRQQPLKMLLAYEQSVSYRPIWGYRDLVKAMVQRRYFDNFRSSVSAVQARFAERRS